MFARARALASSVSAAAASNAGQVRDFDKPELFARIRDSR